jgi:hypothetical protein
MLTIINLNLNEELSSSEMRKVAGGLDCQSAITIAGGLEHEENFFRAAGFSAAAGYLSGLADGLVEGSCTEPE